MPRSGARPGPPAQPPIGQLLHRVAGTVSRAFDEALLAEGGSRSTWLVLLALTIDSGANQRQLARFVGIRGATLSHHLDTMEAAGLVVRQRDPGNRRSHLVRRTPAGDELFARLREAATAFDRRLRRGLSRAEVDELRRLLGVLATNCSSERSQR
ncbi:MAG TPA: MarR family winged helix-turn-helix transcriptional regulator [Marmoricola sp.]|nr:MarR family winged helix-turn-helix transcriptional regulator [Marmoricola sp.]